jgi:hypothetical protein
MHRSLTVLLTSVVSLFAMAGAAQAVVVDMSPSSIGQSSVAYPTDQGDSNYFGVSLVPGTRQPGTAGIPITTSSNPPVMSTIPTVTATAPCTDPALASDLGPFLPNTGLCWHPGGAVMHNNETFVLAWDPFRRYFATTKNYVEQFLRDVADGSGGFTSPYAVTSQYLDPTGRAANASKYGGACTDFGSVGGATCDFSGPATGSDYPQGGCTPTGTNHRYGPNFTLQPNDVCLTDAQLKSEITTMIQRTGVVGHTQPGYTPLLVLMTPPGVEVCLDGSATLCSANSDLYSYNASGGSSTPTVPARFCSYHSQVNVPGHGEFQYVVQPWTAETTTKSTLGCDEPDATPIPNPVDTKVLATLLGQRLVSPLSRAHIAAIVNPSLNGWFALDGSEINDNGCAPLNQGLDSVNVGSSPQNPYLLQREFNNAGLIESDPNALACTPSVELSPTFVVPSAVNQGDVIEFDGSTTVSSLIVSKAGYVWTFGDGTGAVGPSVVHSYAKGGTYRVTLTVTDRGGNVRSLSQTIVVLGASGTIVAPPSTNPTGTSNPGLHARIQLMPQGLRAALRQGVDTRVSSNEPANGFVTISISRGAAKRAHISAGRGSSVVIGRGTVSGIKAGTVSLHLHLSRALAAKLGQLVHVALTVRLALVAPGGDHLAIVAAGRY